MVARDKPSEADSERGKPPVTEDQTAVIDLTTPSRTEDQPGERRDQAAAQRDQAANQRDKAAQQRDKAADLRDHAAEHPDAEVTGAAQDRRSGAIDRSNAGLDRNAALADREASATDRMDAAIDELTGAYLRGAGFAELKREVERARRTHQPLVLAFIDVDRLKSINDSRGHAAGDQMLRKVANTFRANLRPYDLIIRYGGDEFVCAISGLNMTDATMRFALVNAALAESPEPGSVTVGLAELQPHDSPEDLVARADAALYRQRK